MRFLLFPCVLTASIVCRVVAAEPPETVNSHGLVYSKWSGKVNVPDPVAITTDPQGRVYVSASTRRKGGDLDIREHPMWIADDVGLTSVEEKRAFLKDALAPGKLRAPRGGLADHNQDGSIDWKDLTVQTERIYQLRDTDGDGTADKMTVFAEGFNSEVTGIAAGVLYHDGWVYATIAPDLWRLKDTDDDGVADVREVVAHGFGLHIAYAGHDMHGLSVGPDGRIYWSIGDKGVHAKSREGKEFFYPNEGCILRVEPDGANFEVYAHGLRNPQEPAFDDFGDLIAVDNDADFKGEKERLVFIPEGSDSGWRCNYQYMGEKTVWIKERIWEMPWAGQASHHLPPIAYSTNGPAGFKHDPGTALGADVRGMFFLNEFPSGKMRGFRMEHDGATFKPSPVELLNEGVMGVGLSWSVDGSLMVADWGGGYPLDGKGAVWRITVPGAHPERAQTEGELAKGFTGRSVVELSKLLEHADQRVRLGAQFELVKLREGSALLSAARNRAGKLLARVHAIWGYGQLLRQQQGKSSEVLGLLKDENPEIRTQVARILGDVKAGGEEGRALIALLKDSSARTRMQAALALGKLRESSATAALLEMAESDGTVPVLRQAAIGGLAGCASPTQLSAQKSSKSVVVRKICVVALRRQVAPEVAEYLKDSDPGVVNDAARAIHDSVGIPAAMPALAQLAGKAGLEVPAMARAINAGLRVGTVEAASRLLTLALDSSTDAGSRTAALSTLLAWKNPPRLDLVDGYARTWAAAPITSILNAKLDQLLALKDPELKTEAIKIVIAHGLEAKPEQIAAIVGDKVAAGPLRAEAMRLLSGGKREGEAWKTALEVALAAGSPNELQRVAREVLLPEEPARLIAVSAGVLKQGALPDRQQVIGLLAQAADPKADAILARLGQELGVSKSDPGLQLDVLEALQSRATANPSLGKLAEAFQSSKLGVSHGELLQGGDAGLGRDLVQNHLGANCLACHAVSAAGSTVGPNLQSIGLQRERPYLLEALLAPSASIASGFGLASYSLTDKTDISGTPLSETPEAITVRLADGTTKTIPRAQIASQTAAISVMPPMLGILTPREVRNVVSYLASLKAKPKPVKPEGHE